MPSILKNLALLALLANLSLAATFAQFCNDLLCNEGCGIAVDVNNPGCLTQFGRKSIKFTGKNFNTVNLIASPGSTCDCQTYCEGAIVQNAIFQQDNCFVIRSDPVAQSFRFIDGGCPDDQC
ncbi:uncharacterized protein LTR77_002673 [Saxophila tyrrhenica]|uniref:Uncharacterized protein n=1 Tax=Saxophila tyrrhenica TaxID=1690608 RepID=A0AAV9PJM6_9PEZI|nr:hypothetical protein LTR77_002673 [Saxophila tyrrhenica]